MDQKTGRNVPETYGATDVSHQFRHAEKLKDGTPQIHLQEERILISMMGGTPHQSQTEQQSCESLQSRRSVTCMTNKKEAIKADSSAGGTDFNFDDGRNAHQSQTEQQSCESLQSRRSVTCMTNKKEEIKSDSSAEGTDIQLILTLRY